MFVNLSLSKTLNESFPSTIFPLGLTYPILKTIFERQNYRLLYNLTKISAFLFHLFIFFKLFVINPIVVYHLKRAFENVVPLVRHHVECRWVGVYVACY